MTDEFMLAILVVGLGGMATSKYYEGLSSAEAILFVLTIVAVLVIAIAIAWEFFSKVGKEKRKNRKLFREIPASITSSGSDSVLLGIDVNLRRPIFLPDSLRSRHVHILGATGSGKTESVILNLLKQDVVRGYGSIILDAKGDASFIRSLKKWVPQERLKIFDLGSESSLPYDPLEIGSPLEAAQRLFSSLKWSEEYYKSKALSSLQRLFQNHFERQGKNPQLLNLMNYLENPDSFISVTISDTYPRKLAEKDFMELSGLRDQVRTLCTGYLSKILSPKDGSGICLENAYKGEVIYFRLQSLLSPQLVAITGKLILNHLNYMAGTAHREVNQTEPKLLPTYLDEFASFACPEFADLISKARSAGIALHFSHQSIGDLAEVAEGFLNRITDNSATKIVLRINDPDSAEFFARSFGTKLYQKITQRITNAKEQDSAEIVGEGSQREAHQFRAPPDLFKTLPTGVGSVLIAHGFETPHGASSVFTIRFPDLKGGMSDHFNKANQALRRSR